jgi:hypothetical protein
MYVGIDVIVVVGVIFLHRDEEFFSKNELIFSGWVLHAV